MFGYFCVALEFYGFSKYRNMIALMLMVLLGMTEGIGVVMLVPFFNLAGIVPGIQPEEQFCWKAGAIFAGCWPGPKSAGKQVIVMSRYW